MPHKSSLLVKSGNDLYPQLLSKNVGQGISYDIKTNKANQNKHNKLSKMILLTRDFHKNSDMNQ